MSDTSVPAAQIISELRKFCQGHKDANGRYSQAKAAKALGVTAAQLSLTLNDRVNVIPARILKKLGYESKVVYVPKGRTAVKKIKVARDSATGRIVSKVKAKKNPKTTTVETVKRAVKPTAEKTVTRKDIVNEKVTIQEKPKTAARETEAVVIDVMARD
jgi:hypothetical protein